MKWLWVAAMAALAGVAGCGTQPASTASFGAAPARYLSNPSADGSRLLLQCEPAQAETNACQFSPQRSGRPTERMTASEFVPLETRQQYLRRLVGEAAAQAVQRPEDQRDVPVTRQDLGLLQELARRQDSCLADRKYADLLVLCPVPGQASETIVMFIRGLCDRCRFQPVVLRKVQ